MASNFGRELAVSLLVFIVVFSIVFGSRYTRVHNSSAISSDSTSVLYLYERAGLTELMDSLDSLGVQINREELEWASGILGWRSFRTGRYEINEPISYDEFLSNLARGIQDPARVTVLSGSDIGRMSAHLARQLKADSVSFALQFRDSSVVAQSLNLTGEELFSRMLPNTYDMYWTSAPSAVVRRVHREFMSGIRDRYRNLIDQSDFSLQEVVTLASIVEWESRMADEKPMVSGLYINRLNRNMRLQADPTVLYAIGERRRVLYEDYQFEHPYNTYLHAGLPPGPITNPDEASIRAVLEPADHDYLYMVAAPDGRHVFSRTFEEHRRASAEWRNWLREQYRIRDMRERQEAENDSQSG